MSQPSDPGAPDDDKRDTHAQAAARPMTMERSEGVRRVSIEDEMRSAYIDYAMSVIVARALPDVRDGLKPVHRRILYTMH